MACLHDMTYRARSRGLWPSRLMIVVGRRAFPAKQTRLGRGTYLLLITILARAEGGFSLAENFLACSDRRKGGLLINKERKSYVCVSCSVGDLIRQN